MSLLNRSTLKNLFKRGTVPTEVNFADLIDSNVNKVDDGFSQSTTDGWMLSPQGPDKKLMSFYENMRNPDSLFNLSVNPNSNSKGLSINDADNESMLFFRDNGNVGIGTTLPRYKLEVDGLVAMKGRVGIERVEQIPADGRWHIIMDDLKGTCAYEIFARAVGRKGRGRYAMTHAVALGVYGKGTIQAVKSSYGWFFQKIKFRFAGNIDKYRLEMCTAGNYGFTDEQGRQPAVVNYFIAKLWDKSMLPYNSPELQERDDDGAK